MVSLQFLVVAMRISGLLYNSYYINFKTGFGRKMYTDYEIVCKVCLVYIFCAREIILLISPL